MAESVQPKEGDQKSKMVPARDLVALKAKVQKLQEELAEKDEQIVTLENDVKITKANVNDEDDVEGVKTWLVNRDKEVSKREKALTEATSSLNERERKVRAKELASEYEIDTESIEDEEDLTKMEIKARDLYIEKSKAKEEKPPEPQEEKKEAQVFESGSPKVLKVEPKDMTQEQFDAFVKQQKQEALSR